MCWSYVLSIQFSGVLIHHTTIYTTHRLLNITLLIAPFPRGNRSEIPINHLGIFWHFHGRFYLWIYTSPGCLRWGMGRSRWVKGQTGHVTYPFCDEADEHPVRSTVRQGTCHPLAPGVYTLRQTKIWQIKCLIVEFFLEESPKLCY